MPETEQLLGELVRGLEPVRTIPRLRTVAASALALGAVSSALLLGASGVRGDLAVAALRPSLVGVALGLAAIAAGGIVAAIGASVPGRHRAANLGLTALLVGIGLAAAAAGWGLASTGVAVWEGLGLGCLITAVGAGLLPTLPLLVFLIRSLPRSPAAALSMASGGAVAIGGIAVQISCPATGGVHVLIGHALAPVIGGAFLSLLLYPVLRRLRRTGPGLP